MVPVISENETDNDDGRGVGRACKLQPGGGVFCKRGISTNGRARSTQRSVAIEPQFLMGSTRLFGSSTSYQEQARTTGQA
ncbi:unnamed protein product [Prunus armeniaca]|uniref:Uncharacterized protein n=1 Tax=Prunus armeniaca TaxID=36596 RepID=A0A6J5VZ55_PRUAR|nr:unnamed protein product [Prunus armeniaca]